MENTKISGHQIVALTASFTCGTSILVVTSDLAEFAKQDAWICALLSIAMGVPIVLMYCYLGKLFPDKTFVQVIITMFGKLIGWMVSAYFIFLCLSSVAQITSYIGSFMSTQYLPSTPVYVINAYFVAILAIALLYGLEATSRSIEILFHIVWIALLFMLIANISNLKVNNVFPVLEYGVNPVFKGSVFLSSFITWPLIVLNMVYPTHVDNPKVARRSILKGYLLGSAIMFLVILMTILVLGSNVTALSVFPTYLLAKEISFGFVSRIEGFIVGAWVVTLFAKSFFYFYAGLTGISQLFDLKDYKKLVLPAGLVVLVFSNIVYPNNAYQSYWDKYTWPLYIGTFGVILPIVLLFIYILKKFICKYLR